jgi:hypothetical protein
MHECYCRIGRRWNVRSDPKQAVVAERRYSTADVLNDSRSTPAICSEARNALGVAWMRFAETIRGKGCKRRSDGEGGSLASHRTWAVQKGWEEIGGPPAGWEKAKRYLEQALAIMPNSVRVLQNMATLRLLEVDDGLRKIVIRRWVKPNGMRFARLTYRKIKI